MPGKKPFLVDRPMTPTERLRKSHDDRKARGERHIAPWITAEASEALAAILAKHPGKKSEIIEAAILALDNR